jgi:HemY protein
VLKHRGDALRDVVLYRAFHARHIDTVKTYYAQLLRVVQAFDACLPGFEAEDAFVWLSRVEGAQQSQPRAAHLQYLAGMMCLRQRLWGKAQSLLGQAVKNLQAPTLQRKAWVALAELAEQRQDTEAATAAWKQAATLTAD